MIRENIEKIIKILKENYSDVKTALVYSNPFEMLVSTILSARTTDKQVNKITPALFKRFPTPLDFANSSIEEVTQYVKSVGFYKTKASNIKTMAEALLERYNGEVPHTMEDLIILPGVGRKTANVVLGAAFNLSEGIVVDTHVARLSNRLGFSKEKTAEKIEKDLMNLVPKGDWIWFSHALIHHGRNICKARKPDCLNCLLNHICPSSLL